MSTNRLLVLGGTEFVGRAVVDEAVAAGWEVTVFHRGTNRASPSDAVTVLHGDRTLPGGLDALRLGSWDVAVDTWSWAPVAVRDAAALLSDRVGSYVYVSSRSVYADPLPAGASEDAPVVDGSVHDDGFADYARAKRGGELAAVQAFGDRAVLARAGLILGPHENIGRLPWWLARIAEGGEVLAPGAASDPIQYIDARDLAAFLLSAGSTGASGAFNVVSEPRATTLGELLDACIDATGSGATLRWVDQERVLAAGIQPWTQLPVWLPTGPDADAMHHGDVSRAVAAGLRRRPLAETVADTWGWLQALGGVAPQRPDRPVVGLDRAVERAVLAGN
ncbi:Nucleoside-diphosphate-sugar epimerase [Plantibacter sp. VKM Ac-1784]|uniref:Nucleoside-diphosphate-sugar epimerase n=1 Tax=Plantibacter elymi (nom. nud.) TaxID=199708 RepID=A0ABY1RH92_9MICO|nr:NAD-dependent epimerase/dehydratase family protein [Plantibacter sp. VKM Ac-1784]SMQ72737.1 Nucleoside-diphosphate-sugar epimerase [Plantibacter sp. VKM Ac-1784]